MSVIDNFNSIDISELRKEVELRLQWCYAHGHISIETLESRLEDLHSKEDKISIIALVEDLPSPEPSAKEEKESLLYHSGTGKGGENYMSLLGSNSRRGNWDVPEKIDVCALMGSQLLDFREARFPRKTVKIQACTIMGSIDMKFPKGVQVSTRGIPLLGSIDNRVESASKGPRIEVEGFALMGSITASSPRKKQS